LGAHSLRRGGYNIIVDDEFGLWLKQLAGREAVVIIDSCHSGGAVRKIGQTTVSFLEDVPGRHAKFLPVTGYQPPPTVRSISKGADVPESVIFMGASRENEVAMEVMLPGGSRGGFSFGLCDGMKSLRKPSYQELFRHAKKVVKDRLGLSQEPQITTIDRSIMVKAAFSIESEGQLEVVTLPAETEEPSVVLSESEEQPVVWPEPEEQLVIPPEPPEEELLTLAESEGQPVAPPEPEEESSAPEEQPDILPEPGGQPVAPPEIVGQKVLLALQDLEGASQEEMESLKESLGQLPLVQLVKEDAFFDRLLRGEKKDDKYRIRLLNRIGDVEEVGPAATIKELVDNLSSHLEYAGMVKQLARIHHPSPPFKVRAWVTDETRRDFMVGEEIVFGFESDTDCYLLLINLDSEGNFHIRSI